MSSVVNRGSWAPSVPKLKPSTSFKLHREFVLLHKQSNNSNISVKTSAVTDLCLSKSGETLYSVSQDTFLKVYSVAEKRQIRYDHVVNQSGTLP